MNYLKQLWPFSEIVILFALFILAGASCRTLPNYCEKEEEDRIDLAPVFKPVYIAPAKLEHFLGNYQALEPH